MLTKMQKDQNFLSIIIGVGEKKIITEVLIKFKICIFGLNKIHILHLKNVWKKIK